jgi:hypothetical protein
MEHKPLFDPGMHDVAETDLDNHFLRAFAASQTRPTLIAGLRVFIASLRRVGIAFEIWLDGSFCTNKTNPNDIDLVVFADENHLNALDPVKQKYLNGLLDRASARAQFGCDVLFCPAGDFNMRSYWRGWYGFDRNENPKGIVKLVVAP